jgi:hypothetical protein
MKHDPERSVEKYRGKNLQPALLPTDRDRHDIETSQTVTDMTDIPSETVTDALATLLSILDPGRYLINDLSQTVTNTLATPPSRHRP